MKLTRRDLINHSIGAFLASRSGWDVFKQESSLAGEQSPSKTPSGNEFYLRIVKANDARVPSLIGSVNGAQVRRIPVRRVAGDLQGLAAAFCAPESSFFKAEALVAPMEKASRFLLDAQHPDGTIDSGNLESPPDTGFVVEAVCPVLTVLRKTDSPHTQRIKDNLGKFILAAGEALVTGGVHTPNHRWVICSALAQTNALFPASKYVDRINDWLGEGIYIDADGQYPERSTGIYSRVEDYAFVTMARLLDRPELLEPVRKNLEMNIYYTHPDGEVETVGSRRQDQFTTATIANYHLEYRYLAIKDRNRAFAGVVRLIEGMEGQMGRLSNSLIYFLEEPLLKEPLPEGRPLPSDYAKFFANSALVRIRRANVSATIYGGSDWPLGVASGLASNPTFFNFRKGKAVLESVRMGAAFFSKGFFHSQGLKVNGNQYVLHERLEVPYYQPLERGERNSQGDYPLTPAEDRFWSKMNFPRRRMSEIKTLDQTVTITENNGAFELEVSVIGPSGVPVTIELSFRRGGKLEGVRQAQPDVFFLEKNMGRYVVGDDSIEFGPGRAEHQRINMEGASYSAHRGVLKTGGDCVYITGHTPFREKIAIK
jgi:hypothetical protein